MRVLHVITGLATGGAEMTLCNLVDRLPHESEVVALAPEGPVAQRIRAAGVPVASLGVKGPLQSPAALVALRRRARRMRPDVVQGWMYHGNLAATFAAPRGARVAWNVRCMPTGRLALSLCARVSRRPDVVLYNSQRARDAHERDAGFRPRRTDVIPNGFDAARFRFDPARREETRKELGLSEDALVVGHVARYDPLKDHAGFFAAAAQVAKREPRARFVLAGRGVENLRHLAAAAGVADRVHLLGERSDPERLYPAFDALALSSTAEGFPNVVGEAMACEVPCVVTDVGDAADLVGDTGLVVPASDPSALAEAILATLELAPEARRERGRAARRRVETAFSLDATVDRYARLYESLLAARA